MKEVAAGGVVFRRKDGSVEIQLIEDRFGKITLPKGRMEAGETPEETALREIAEETGIQGRIIRPLMMIRYQYEGADRGIIDKEVHYFLVEAEDGDLKAQTEEITGVAWYAPSEAWRLQETSGYDNNQPVLAAAFGELGITI
jgi:8-oxo-dGTP pyrophosphatase MutT (NUDIX family)